MCSACKQAAIAEAAKTSCFLGVRILFLSRRSLRRHAQRNNPRLLLAERCFSSWASFGCYANVLQQTSQEFARMKDAMLGIVSQYEAGGTKVMLVGFTEACFTFSSIVNRMFCVLATASRNSCGHLESCGRRP